MATKFVRCNAILSYALDKEGKTCKQVITDSDEAGVLQKMIEHISECQGIDATDLTENITLSIKTP